MPLKGFTPEITNSEIGKLIGREIIKLENGESEVSFEMTESWLNMQGILHGGAFATMLDTAWVPPPAACWTWKNIAVTQHWN